LDECKSTCFEKSISSVTSFHIISTKRIIQVKLFNSSTPFIEDAEFSYFKFYLSIPIIRCIQNRELETNSTLSSELELLNPASMEGQFLWNDLLIKHLFLSFKLN
jgi:hypothetical protein